MQTPTGQYQITGRVHAEIMHMTTIWYCAATSGDTPDNICPVIMPGNATMPTASNALICGMRAAFNADRQALSISLLVLSDSKRSAARLIEFMQLEKIMPASGIM